MKANRVIFRHQRRFHEHVTAMVRRIFFVWIDVNFFTKVVYVPDFCPIPLIISLAKVVPSWEIYAYSMTPEVNFTRSHHFCSIVSDMSSNLQDVTLTCSNCGVLGVAIDPCEYCRMLPQCRKCRRRMPGRCFAKLTTANIWEVRNVPSVSIVWTFLTLHLNKQTRFSVIQISPYVVQNCNVRKSRYQKLKSRAVSE